MNSIGIIQTTGGRTCDVLDAATVLTIRTVGAGSTVGHHESGGGTVSEVDGISIRQTAGHRTGDAGNTVAGSSSCAVNTVGHREGAIGTIGIVDGVGIHIARTHRASDVHDTATVLAIGAVGAVRTISTGITLRAL